MENKSFNFVLATDSACDLPKEVLAEMNVESRDLTYIIDGVEYADDVSDKVEFHEFYDKMRNGAKTNMSMINEDAARIFLTELSERGEDILYLSFDSALSGTYANFKRVAEELNVTAKNKIYVVDSLCAAGGQGLFVTLVNEKRLSGASFEETCEYAEEIKHRVMHYFTVEDLKYLARGGRLSKGTAIVGNLINIKPVLHVDPIGRLVPFKKVIGRRKSVIALFKSMVERYNGESKLVYISHGDCYGDAKLLADMIKEKFDIDATFLPLDYVIGSHSGPGTLALFFTGDDRAEKHR